MHKGEDTLYYLAKGFSVVAIEANPALVESTSQRFRKEIDSGRLAIVHSAITDTHGSARLAVADAHTVWSSLSPEFITRNETNAGTQYHYVDVPTRPFGEVLSEFGIPYYLKIDIEGFDMLCVRALRDFQDKPRFVSVESSVSVTTAPVDAAFDELAELWTLGYRDFKYVNQNRPVALELPYPAREGQYVEFDFINEGSGPFGEETPGNWHPIGQAVAIAEMLRRQQNFAGAGGRWSGTLAAKIYKLARGTLRRPVGWFDLHARLPD